MADFVDFLPQLPFPDIETTVLPKTDVEEGLRLWALIVICICVSAVVIAVVCILARCFAGQPVQLQVNRINGLQLQLGGRPAAAAPTPSVRTVVPANGASASLAVTTVSASPV
jgi:hypothetical protein